MVGPKTSISLHKFCRDFNLSRPNSQICVINLHQVGGMESSVTLRRAMKPSISVVVMRMVY